MKLVTAVVKPFKIEEVKDALKQGGLVGLTVDEVMGFGRQGGHVETHRGSEYNIDFLPKVRLQVVVEDGDADRAVDLISEAANTGKIGDGKIWVSDVSKVMRIRTGELDSDAI
jgi:nitrogen regulatory protein P-II 1